MRFFLSLFLLLAIANASRHVVYLYDVLSQPLTNATFPLDVCVSYKVNVGTSYGIFSCNADKTKVLLSKYGGDEKCQGEPTEVPMVIETLSSRFDCDGDVNYFQTVACKTQLVPFAAENNKTRGTGVCCQDFTASNVVNGCGTLTYSTGLCTMSPSGNYSKQFCDSTEAYTQTYWDSDCTNEIDDGKTVLGKAGECGYLTSVNQSAFFQKDVYSYMPLCIQKGKALTNKYAYCGTPDPTMEPTMAPSPAPNAATTVVAETTEDDDEDSSVSRMSIAIACFVAMFFNL